MAKAKKAEKRSAPKKAAKNQADRILGKLKHVDEGLRKAFANPDPAPKKKSKPVLNVKPASKVVKLVTKPSRYPERVPEKPPEPEQPKVEVSVRNIYHDSQYLPSLCFRKPGSLHVPCVTGDPINGIRKFTVQVMQHDKSPVLQHGFGAFAAPYTPERFAAHMRKLASSAAITPEARALLLPYAPDMPSGPSPAELPPTDDGSQPVTRRIASGNGSRSASGPSRTSGKELIRTLAAAAKLPPEKVRAKLRAAGMRAPYTDEGACRKALGVA